MQHAAGCDFIKLCPRVSHLVFNTVVEKDCTGTRKLFNVSLNFKAGGEVGGE